MATSGLDERAINVRRSPGGALTEDVKMGWIWRLRGRRRRRVGVSVVVVGGWVGGGGETGVGGGPSGGGTEEEVGFSAQHGA